MIIYLLLSSFLSLSASLCKNYTASTCEFVFAYNRCSFAYCTKFQTPPNTQNATALFYSWQDCLHQCCTPNAGLMTNRTAEILAAHCSAQPSEDSLLLTIIAFSIGIPALLFLLICCYCRRLQSPPVAPSEAHQDTDDLHRPTIKTVSWGELHSPVSHGTSSLEVQKKSESILEIGRHGLEGEVCSICLEDNANSKVECGHMFHSRCLSQWLAKKQSCPDCRATMLYKIEITCSTCLKSPIIVKQADLTQEYVCKWCKLLPH